MKILLLTFLILIFSNVASACLCDTLPSVEKAYSESAAIFTAKYIGSEYRKGIKSETAEIENEISGKKRDYEVLIYKFAVSKWWKSGTGTGNDAILVADEVRFADGSTMISDCGLWFEKRKDYLIYAYGDAGSYGTGVCTRTRQLKRAAADIASLRKLT